MANEAGNKAGDRDGAEGASGADRLTAPPDDARAPRLPFPVVGIGASAGGLEAYTEFLQACPADAGIAYVLVQHLPPDRESMLVELLARHTAMPVAEVIDGQSVEPDRVHVIRPGHTLTIRDGRLHLGAELAARGHGRPVDDFFRSLAEEQQQRAVAVVFSGMGSNGTAGAQAVKAVGGLVIAQEPETAKFPAMPRSLIDAHLPDYILRPAEVPDALARYAGHPYAAADADAPTVRDEQALGDVLAVLRTRTRHDFSGYRKPTLLRRVRRRMGLGQFPTVPDYVKALRQTPAEVTALADDLLIHVTGFFRDPEAWAVLREKVIDPIAEGRPDGAEVRCWVSACATGEEAYSLAMLLVEAADARGKRFDVKVFATDMAERALGAARTGVFPNGVESEIAPERLARFFDKDDSFYRVKKELRELVIFAPQNVLQDPPFSRLDIVTCRNLLIYLEPDTQRRVLALLHFGLREGGALLLGSSESAAPADGDFEPIDKRHRLFRRVGPTRPGTLDVPAMTAAIREGRLGPPAGPARTPTPVAAQLATRALLDGHTPPAVAVDAAGQVVYVHGDTGRYLTLPTGGPTHDLLALANEAVRGAVRTALHRATDGHAAVAVRDGVLDTPAGRRRVEVGVAPLGPRESPLYLVTFHDYPDPPPPPAAGDGSSAARLADELQRTRNELQSALEEMQSSTEELKASHEEATSLNEELQSTNEELETSKEEMQSLNEELVTVNAQLQAKMTELEATANDLGSLLTSTDIAVLFLDPRFRIRRFTPAVRDLLDLIPSDVGRPLADLRRKFTDPDLAADAQAVLDRLIPVERAVESDSGRHYLRRVLPYRTQDNRIDGVVVAFVDVTDRKRAEEAVREREAWIRGQREALEAALNGAPLEASLAALARTATDGLGEGTRAAFYLADAGGTPLRHVVGMPAEYAAAVDGFETGPESLAGGLATHRGQPVITPDVAADPRWERWREVAARFDYRGCWSFPIHTAAGRFVGTLAVYSRGPREASAGDLLLASLLTDTASIIIARHAEAVERRRAEDAVRTSEEQLRSIQASATDYAILTFAPDLTITGWSPGAVVVLGYTEEEAVGRPLEMIFTPEDRAAGAPAAEAEKARRTGRAADERWHLRKDGSRFFASGVLSRLGDDGGRGFVKVLRDLTERKRMEDELEGRVRARTTELSAALDALEAEMTRRAALAGRLATAQEDERRRIARDLHDTVGQLLTGLSLAVRSVQSAGLSPAAAGKLAEVEGLADALSRETHALAVRLRPTVLDDVGLAAALEQLVGEWSSRNKVRADYTAAGLGPSRLPPEVETALYRIVQEALTNVAKHARATQVSVTLGRRNGTVTAVVEDDGVGFDPNATPTGRLGLLGMRERVHLIGGEMDIESSPGAGTTLLVRIPVTGETP